MSLKMWVKAKIDGESLPNAHWHESLFREDDVNCHSFFFFFSVGFSSDGLSETFLKRSIYLGCVIALM